MTNTRICLFCKKEFTIKNNRQRTKKYCNTTCYGRYWVKANPEKIRRNQRKYVDKHRDRQRERSKKWYWENRQKALAYQKTLKSDNNSRGRAKNIMRDKPKICSSCSSVKNIHIHHLDFNPQNNNVYNLIFLCSLCHGLAHRKR